MADLHPVIETLEHRWMRAWVGGDTKILKSLTSRRFRLVIGSKPSVMLDQKSFLDAAAESFTCSAYRLGDIYVRDLGGVTIFATQMDLQARIEGEDFSGMHWITDLWRKSKVRRRWTLVERIISRPEEHDAVAPAVRSLQLWHGRKALAPAR